MAKVRKAIIPAAGYGTRFLPATKAMPKEMLPIVDKPIIQYVVEELVASGIEDVIIVTGWNKRAIEDHFDRSQELEDWLKEQGKEKELKEITEIAHMANFIYVRQKGPYGTAVPVMAARHLVEKEPFLVVWGDDFIYADPPRAKQMIEIYQKFKGSVLCAIKTDDKKDRLKYGFLEGPPVDEGVILVKSLKEKPGISYTNSDLASVSGFLLTPSIFQVLEKLKPGRDGELWLADAISALAKKEAVYALEIKDGKFYDCGNKIEYIKANIEFALKRKEFNSEFKKYLKSLQL